MRTVTEIIQDPKCKCKKLPSDATKQMRIDMHKVMMGRRKIIRDRLVLEPRHIIANLSRNHPQYGMTPTEYTAHQKKVLDTGA